MGSINVKICGLTNLADAEVAIAAGADLLGFILYAKSPRYVTPAAVAEIVTTLRAQAGTQGTRLPRLVGVFVNAPQDEIMATVTQVGLDFVQLHGNETPALVTAFAGRAYKALRPAEATLARAQAAEFAPLGPATGPAWMLDAYDPAAYGGTGKQADWQVAATLAQQHPGLLLAGGLTPENVAAAIRTVHPWGVDVGSGVEAAPGRKDHTKVQQFVAMAKAGL
ncbi:MAG: phosphoribosylanthranilate isomerase [Caldilineaceae bacterium]